MGSGNFHLPCLDSKSLENGLLECNTREMVSEGTRRDDEHIKQI